MASIARVETEILPDPANPQLLVHVTDDEGQTGTGETWWGHYRPDLEPGSPVIPYAATIDAVLGPTTVGLPVDTVDDVAAIWDRLVRSMYQYGDDGIVRGALSGIDIALWDLIGRRQGVPVTRLLGPVAHKRIPVYASLTWHGDVDPILDDVERARHAGFQAVKLHESDPEVIVGVCRRLDREITVMVDASASADEAGAIDLAGAVAELGLAWLEEPIYPQRDHAALARLRNTSETPVAAGENEFSVAGIEALMLAGAVDVVQPEIAKVGGLTEARRISAIVEQQRIALAPHNYSLGPSFMASWHWAASSRATSWLEVPWLPDGQTWPGAASVPHVDAGTIGSPPGPGLGLGLGLGLGV